MDGRSSKVDGQKNGYAVDDLRDEEADQKDTFRSIDRWMDAGDGCRVQFGKEDV